MSPKPSTIKQLPEDILEKLQELLRDPRCSQLEATRQINEIIADRPDVYPVSKSAVNRYSQDMEQVGARLRESREVSKMWIAQLGAAPQGQVGNLINEILRTIAFDLSIKLQNVDLEENTPAAVKGLKDLALAMQRLEKAANLNHEREKEIRQDEREAALADAADTIEQAATAKGMSKEDASFWRQQVLGVRS